MAQSGLSSTWGAGSGDGAGGRRRKVYGYFKAANELRQAYQAQWTAQKNETSSEDYYNTPGAFPDVEIARSGDEEMVLFPSYARRLIPKSKRMPMRHPVVIHGLVNSMNITAWTPSVTPTTAGITQRPKMRLWKSTCVVGSMRLVESR
jgi:hypothetical protein